MKPILIYFFSILCLDLSAQEKQVKTDSKISQVIVFLSGAQIQRQASADIPSGISQVIFSGLSPDIEAQSIQAKGEGAFTILAVNRQSNFLEEQKSNEERINLQNQIEDLQDKIAVQQNLIEVLKSEEVMLSKNQTVGTETIGLDLAKLKLALDFQKTRLSEAKNKQLEVQRSIGKLNQELLKMRRQLNGLNGKSKSNTSDIVVKVQSKTALKASLTITYLIKNASWYPTYDIRAKDVSSPIELVYKANVTQRSGEDWKDVNLVLSSGDPSTGANKPELKPYLIGYNILNLPKALQALTAVRGSVIDAKDRQPLVGVSVMLTGSTAGTSTDVNGNYSLQIPSGSQSLKFAYVGYNIVELPIRSAEINVSMQPSLQQLNEVVTVGYGSAQQELLGSVAGVRIRGVNSEAKMKTEAVQVEAQQSQTSIQFDIKTPYTILSDGKQFTVDIGQYEMKADYEYYSAPKISPTVFLTARLTDFADINLLSGEANIFFEGAFLGKSLIDMQNSTDTLGLSLGIDKNVTIKRERSKEFNERQFIGSNQRVTRNFAIDIKNRKAQKINLIVEDQLPISTSSDITVEKQEISNAMLDETSGKLIWKLELQPNEQKKLQLKYQVRYPKNRTLNIE